MVSIRSGNWNQSWNCNLAEVETGTRTITCQKTGRSWNCKNSYGSATLFKMQKIFLISFSYQPQKTEGWDQSYTQWTLSSSPSQTGLEHKNIF
jgi:hypothetical protein